MVWRKWLKWSICALAVLVAPFMLAAYVHCLVRFIDWLSPARPHTRLLLWAHYVGAASRLIGTSPALVGVVVIAGLIMFREFFRRLFDRIESFAIGKLSAKFSTQAQLTPGVPASGPIVEKIAPDELVAPVAPLAASSDQSAQPSAVKKEESV